MQYFLFWHPPFFFLQTTNTSKIAPLDPLMVGIKTKKGRWRLSCQKSSFLKLSHPKKLPNEPKPSAVALFLYD